MSYIYKFSLKPKLLWKDSVFVLGAFESFHKGHFQLIEQAKQLNKPIVLVAISNPENLPKNNGKIFSDLKSRLQIIANSGIENILLIEFNEKIANLEGDHFINLLIQYGASDFVIGKNYNFGKLASWNAKKLKEYIPTTQIVDFYYIENKVKLSTSILKNYLIFGQFKILNSYLNHNYLTYVSCDENLFFKWNTNSIKPNAGLYVIYFVNPITQYKFPGILHISLSNEKNQIFLFNHFNFFEGFIEIIAEYRIISSTRFDLLEDKDIEGIKKIFFNLYTNSTN